MNLYPWLKNDYKKIIYPYHINRGHHSVIIESHKEIEITNLMKNISSWILCQNKTNIYHCKKCHSCKLMNTENHPDWHNVELIRYNSENTLNTIGVHIIRNLSNVIFKSAQQGKNKIVYIPDTEKLTEYSINSLLKIIEEPPRNTYFFFVNYIPNKLISTLRSRCVLYYVHYSSKKNNLEWLKEKNSILNRNTCIPKLYRNQEIIIPEKKNTLSVLQKERTSFFDILLFSFETKNLLNILNILKKNNLDKKFLWIYSIILDSIKWKTNIKTTIINIDQTKLIKILASNFSISLLDNSYRSWIYCHNNITNISGINIELLLVKQLLYWEKILNFFPTILN